MPLILAVEPNPLRLAHVTSLTRGRPRADLLIAESVRAALSAIVARVPDVLLISPEVSAEDRARITSCLKGLGRSGAHAMIFTTPAPTTNTSRTETLPPSLIEGMPPTPVTAVPDTGTAAPSVQNEWGFFDPRLCGFSALARSNNTGESSEIVQPDPALVRLIPY
jgi:hypothetical protein